MHFVPRKLLFKAWNQQTKLLMRLNTIDCIKGELYRKDHILLQFTGLFDMQHEEIYEMDMLLIDGKKFLVRWDETQHGWGLTALPETGDMKRLMKELSAVSLRICSYFESEHAV
jgi:hypothetical protein